jgi:hypothetical protein
MYYLAHGALGPYDELIFLGVASIFIVMMGISWFQTRMSDYDDDQRPGGDIPVETTPRDYDDPSPDHFTLD